MPEHASSSSLAAKREMFLKIQKHKELNNKERITPRERTGRIPVSFVQEGGIMAVVNKLYDPDITRPHGPALGYIIKGRANIPAFSKAIKEVVKRHEILRTNYEVVDGEPYQVINEVPDSILKVVDLKILSDSEKKDEVSRITKDKASEPFNFLKDKLMLTATMITAKDEHALYIPTNHSGTDYISSGILQAELLALYQSHSLNIPIPLPDLSLQYADFATWERERFAGEYLEKKLEYWKQLSGKVNASLPRDHTPDEFSYDGDSVPVAVLPELTKQLKDLSRANSVTLFTVMFAAFMNLIHIFSGYKCNILSMPVANRAQKETERLLGCFTTWQHVHVDMSGDPNFLEMVDRTNKTLLKVYDNYVPFNFMIDAVKPGGPLVDFQLQTASLGSNSARNATNDEHLKPEEPSKEEQTMPETRSEKGPSISQGMSQAMMFIPLRVPQPVFALFPIAVSLSEFGDVINGDFKYNTGFYDRSTIVNLTNDYVLLLSQIIKNPEIRISEIKIRPHKSVVDGTN